ncbi:hypothetical protein C8R45DRAFT_1205242 [Mycena sanguinolenta]|nr:hypothetical protein C8R45DRAFT_1205242 [Mycena sanguinolenta]
MPPRGRDRAVSEAAKARLKSQERQRTHSASRSPSPLSSASLSPRSRSRSPTPSLTLADRIHIAYGEDVHLAKVLLLRLQGIEVTSDSDPRIAAVKDEDFDACFIPFGPLDDGRGPQPPMAKQPCAELDPEARRAEALRAKERMWETEARRFADERARHAALKQRQDSAWVEQERIRLVKQKEAAAAAVDLHRRRNIKPTARTLNFALVPPVPKPAQKFTYDFPFTPRHVNIPTRTTIPPPPLRRSPEPKPKLEQQSKPERTRVPFVEVLASMHGDLFPVLPCERNTLSTSADRSKARRERALLDALLVAGVDLDFSGKGKRRAATPPPCACRAASPASVSPSSSSSGLSRAGSWLSFGSSSRSSRSSVTSTSSGISASWASTSTILSSSLSASSSDAPPPLKSQSRRLSMNMSTWLPGARRTTSPESSHLALTADKCACRRRRSVQVLPRTAVHTHPLYAPPEPPSHAQERRRALGLGAQDHPQTAGHMPFTLALGRLAALARNLQTSYVRAVVVGYGVGGAYEEREFDDEECEREEEEHESQIRSRREREPTFRPPPAPLASKLRVRPVGTRALRGDVRRFLEFPSLSASPPVAAASAPTAADDDLAPLAVLSPLPFSKSKLHYGYGYSAQIPPPPARTPLPAYPPPRVFAPPQPLPRSPWAPQRVPVPVSSAAASLAPSSAAAVTASESEGVESWHGDAPAQSIGGVGVERREDEEGEKGDEYTYAAPRQPVLRARAVPNSAFLRVKALQRAASYASSSSSSSAFVSSASASTSSSASASASASSSSASASASASSTATGPSPLAAGSGGPSTSSSMRTTSMMPTPPLTPRRPRECVVGLGVDYAPGSGLRFVYASARAVVV